MLNSRLCTQSQFETPTYRQWCARLHEVPRLHRKQWEYCYIAEALHERGMLAPGRRGLGFGVGEEPLAALFASYGCHIVATDMDAAQASAVKWTGTGQHASDVMRLNHNSVCDAGMFAERVVLQTVDMNTIPDDLCGFDFTWSACALEHLGSLEASTRFVLRSLDCLRPGGVAVHTTEFNVSSDTDTLSNGDTVLFRRRDVEALAAHLRGLGYTIDLDLDQGSGPADGYVDVPPYQHEPHLKLLLGGFVTTSLGLIVG
jgi:SAM-dependent methyltransferase